MEKLCRFGTNRVIEPKGVLPQAATKIDNTMIVKDNEILIDVITLNIDSASFIEHFFILMISLIISISS